MTTKTAKEAEKPTLKRKIIEKWRKTGVAENQR